MLNNTIVYGFRKFVLNNKLHADAMVTDVANGSIPDGLEFVAVTFIKRDRNLRHDTKSHNSELSKHFIYNIETDPYL